MIRRVVKMVFKTEEIDRFQSLFEEKKDLIKGSEGCLFLQLLQDNQDERVHFTISDWESDQHLQNYRNSQLFGETWKVTKSLFEEQAQAWSLNLISQPTSLS